MAAPARAEEEDDKRSLAEVIGKSTVLRFDTTTVPADELTEAAVHTSMDALLPGRAKFNITPDMIAAEFDETEFKRIFFIKTGVTVLEKVWEVSSDLCQCVKHPKDADRIAAIARKHSKSLDEWKQAVIAIAGKPDGLSQMEELTNRHLSDYLAMRRRLGGMLAKSWYYYRREVVLVRIRKAHYAGEAARQALHTATQAKAENAKECEATAAKATLELMHTLRAEVKERGLPLNQENMMTLLKEATESAGKFAALA